MDHSENILGEPKEKYNENIWGTFLNTMLEKAINDRGKANILIVGITGGGKTTLINEIFGEELGKTGLGKPVTQGIEEVKKDGIPIVVYDTQGLELKDYQPIRDKIIDLARTRRHDPNPRNHIHIAWICIQDSSDRVMTEYQELARTLAGLGIPTIVVITKSEMQKELSKSLADGRLLKLTQMVQEIIPGLRGIVRTRSLKKPYEHDGKIYYDDAFGLDTLVHRTMALVPEVQQNAILAAQKVDISLKKEKANKCLVRYIAASGVAGFVPPVVGIPASIATQIAMMIEISVIWGFPATEAFIISLCWGSASSGFALSNIASAIVRLVPFLGAIPSAILTSTITGIIGETSISTLTVLTRNDMYKQLKEKDIIKEFHNQLEIRKRNL